VSDDLRDRLNRLEDEGLGNTLTAAGLRFDIALRDLGSAIADSVRPAVEWIAARLRRDAP
jgi:hypothetical protein